MIRVYLPLVLSLASPLPAGPAATPTAPPPQPTATIAEPSATATAAPSETATPAPPAPTEPAPTETSTAAAPTPSATQAAPGTPVTVGVQPISTRLARESSGDEWRWTMWAEYDNPSKDRDVSTILPLTGTMRDTSGGSLGERRASSSGGSVLAPAGGRGCFKVSWTTPKAAARTDWTIRAMLERGRTSADLPAEIRRVSQASGSAWMEVEASAPVTRTTTTRMTAILRDARSAVVVCGSVASAMDPGEVVVYRLAIGERVLATAPQRSIAIRAALNP